MTVFKLTGLLYVNWTTVDYRCVDTSGRSSRFYLRSESEDKTRVSTSEVYHIVEEGSGVSEVEEEGSRVGIRVRRT